MEATEQKRRPQGRLWVEARCALWENWPDLPDEARPNECSLRAEVVFHDTHEDGCRHWLLCEDHANLMQLHMRHEELNHGHINHARMIDQAFEGVRVGGCTGC